MKFNVEVNAKDFEDKLDNISSRIKEIEREALEAVGDGMLELSLLEVPKDTGELSESGKSDVVGESVNVSYNAPHALRMHEHPEYKFQHGRKGKYLEDPVKQNLSKWEDIYARKLAELL